MGLACAYGLFVQTIYNTDVYFPASVLSYITSKQWFSRCLSPIFAPLWCSAKCSAPRLVASVVKKVNSWGATPHLLNRECSMAEEPMLYVATYPAGDFNLRSWLRATAPLKYLASVSSGPRHLHCTTFGFSCNSTLTSPPQPIRFSNFKVFYFLMS